MTYNAENCHALSNEKYFWHSSFQISFPVATVKKITEWNVSKVLNVLKKTKDHLEI